jgi:hypothetical protein
MLDLSDDMTVIHLVLLLSIVQVVLSAWESLVGRRIYRPGQLLDWAMIVKSRSFYTATAGHRKFFDFIFSYPNILGVLLLRLMTALLLVWAILAGKGHLPVLLLTMTITFLGILLEWRHIYSNNGADQLANIILISVSIAMLGSSGSAVVFLSIIFIACQSQLSYITSGLFKLLEAGWRDGSNLQGILATATFGHPTLKRFLDPTAPRSYVVASYVVMVGELILGFSFCFPPSVCLGLLACGMLFHVSVAMIMGLNTFVWAFAATYPAIYYISLKIY